MIEIKNLDAKWYFRILIVIIILTDLVILLNISIIRQVLTFLCFTTIPGLLILHILKLNNIQFLKKFVLCIGLSIVFLVFGGLFVNTFYPFILKPLSLESILISFNVILLTLAFIAYRRNKDDFDINGIFNFEIDLKDELTSPLIFPIIFPFMAVFGTYLMNSQESNIILLVMLFLIIAYVITIVYLGNRVSKNTYPIAIIMIGISLLLMHTLTSSYLIGRDIHIEYYVFRLTTNNLHWDISNYWHAYNACLSITILPTIYKFLLGVDGLYIFKIVYPLLGAITPLICYIIFKKYINEKYAFLASFFFMAQVPFRCDLQSATRTEFAMLFFALAILVFFDDETDKLNKKILFLIFMFAMVVSHYSTSYIFFIMVFVIWLDAISIKKISKSNRNHVTATIVILLFAIIFFWYGQVTLTPFNDVTHYVQNTFINLGNFFVDDMRAQSATAVLGQGVKGISRWIVLVVQDTTIAFITIGLFGLIGTYKETKFERDYILLMLISWGLMAAMLIVPYLSTGYGVYRTYQMGLIILAPMFVIGGDTIFRYINLRKFSLLAILIVLILQFFCATYVIDQVFGNPNSEDLNREGDKYGEYYIYDSEIAGARWLNEHGTANPTIHTDARGYTRILMVYDTMPHLNKKFFEKNKTIKNGYIYLRYINIVNGKIYPTDNYADISNITEYSHLFIGKSKIYNNGGSEVYI